MPFTLGIISVSTPQYATWSPTAHSSRISLSNSNLTFTGSGFVGTGVATIGKSFGKWYWEVLINSSTLNVPVAKVGIANYLPVSGNTEALGQQGAGTGQAYGYRGGTPCIYGPSTPTSQGTGCTGQATGQRYSFLLDLDAHTLGIYINGTLARNITSIAAGTWYPACGSDAFSGAGTANFGAGGAGSFTYYGTIGTGYNPGIYS